MFVQELWGGAHVWDNTIILELPSILAAIFDII